MMQQAPGFTLTDAFGAPVSLKDLLGSRLVVFFYPAAMTPGCTAEACDFRDRLERIEGHGATVIGVSKDSVTSNDRFRAKHELPLHLISDKELELQQAYGAWGLKKMRGREYMGTIRSTFLVSAEGTIARAWPYVRVKGHVDEVLNALEELAS